LLLPLLLSFEAAATLAAVTAPSESASVAAGGGCARCHSITVATRREGLPPSPPCSALLIPAE
jgi:hypothetical protein